MIFAICLVLATILWFLNALSKNYTTQIAYPVKYVNLPKNKFIINEPPSDLLLRVNAHGFTLLRYKLHLTFYPVLLNISEIMEETRIPSGGYVTIRPGEVMEKITAQISNDLHILDVRPASLHLVFDSLESRIVPVKPHLDLHFVSRFDIAGNIVTIPPYIEITGPRVIVEKTDTIFTLNRTFRNIKNDLIRDIPLDIPKPENITTSVEKVNVRVPVDEYTEKSLTVPINVRSLPEGVTIRLFPREAEISLRIGLKEFASISGEAFPVYVDWKDIESGLQFLPVRTDTLPEGLKSLKIVPLHVEYLIEK